MIGAGAQIGSWAFTPTPAKAGAYGRYGSRPEPVGGPARGRTRGPGCLSSLSGSTAGALHRAATLFLHCRTAEERGPLALSGPHVTGRVLATALSLAYLLRIPRRVADQ